jgi:L-amino acid N-acyltransferase YncA
MARRVASTLPGLPWLVCDRSGEVLGYAYAGGHRSRAAYQWSVEVSAYVGEPWHRRGIGLALYESLFRVLVLQGYVNAYAGVTLPNPASEGLHSAAGFAPVGVYHGIGWKAGRWHDVLWLERRLSATADAPRPPRSTGDLVGTAGLADALASGEHRLRL